MKHRHRSPALGKSSRERRCTRAIVGIAKTNRRDRHNRHVHANRVHLLTGGRRGGGRSFSRPPPPPPAHIGGISVGRVSTSLTFARLFFFLPKISIVPAVAAKNGKHVRCTHAVCRDRVFVREKHETFVFTVCHTDSRRVMSRRFLFVACVCSSAPPSYPTFCGTTRNRAAPPLRRFLTQKSRFGRG